MMSSSTIVAEGDVVDDDNGDDTNNKEEFSVATIIMNAVMSANGGRRNEEEGDYHNNNKEDGSGTAVMTTTSRVGEDDDDTDNNADDEDDSFEEIDEDEELVNRAFAHQHSAMKDQKIEVFNKDPTASAAWEGGGQTLGVEESDTTITTRRRNFVIRSSDAAGPTTRTIRTLGGPTKPSDILPTTVIPPRTSKRTSPGGSSGRSLILPSLSQNDALAAAKRIWSDPSASQGIAPKPQQLFGSGAIA